jgi:hypothetical protein
MIMNTLACPVCGAKADTLTVSLSEYQHYLRLIGRDYNARTLGKNLVARAFPNLPEPDRRRIWDGMCPKCVPTNRNGL